MQYSQQYIRGHVDRPAAVGWRDKFKYKNHVKKGTNFEMTENFALAGQLTHRRRSDAAGGGSTNPGLRMLESPMMMVPSALLGLMVNILSRRV